METGSERTIRILGGVSAVVALLSPVLGAVIGLVFYVMPQPDAQKTGIHVWKMAGVGVLIYLVVGGAFLLWSTS